MSSRDPRTRPGRRGGRRGVEWRPSSSHKKRALTRAPSTARRGVREGRARTHGGHSRRREARAEWERARRDPPRRFGARRPGIARQRAVVPSALVSARAAATAGRRLKREFCASLGPQSFRPGRVRARRRTGTGAGAGVRGDEARRTATSRASRRESRTRPRAAEWASESSLGSTAATGGAADRWMESADPRRTVRSPDVVHQVRAKSSNPVRHSPSRLAPRSRSSGMTEWRPRGRKRSRPSASCASSRPTP